VIFNTALNPGIHKLSTCSTVQSISSDSHNFSSNLHVTVKTSRFTVTDHFSAENLRYRQPRRSHLRDQFRPQLPVVWILILPDETAVCNSRRCQVVRLLPRRMNPLQMFPLCRHSARTDWQLQVKTISRAELGDCHRLQ